MEKILIIDVSAVIYRAHYALSELVNKKGMYTGACFGFVKQLEKEIELVKPDYIVAALDNKRNSLDRTKEYENYKSNRKEMPQELKMQLPYINDIIEKYNIKAVSYEGLEADDVIASFAHMFSKKGIQAHIFTGDKDLQQIIKDDEMIHIHILGKDIVVKNYEDVKSYLSVYPNQIPDFFGLIGDSSDGIPGVKGVGPKTGEKLINEYDNLDNIYENIDNIKGSLKQKLEIDKELAYLSKKLATIEIKELNDDILDYKFQKKDNDGLKEIFENLELKSLMSTIKIEKKDLEVKKLNFSEINQMLKSAKKAILFEKFDYLAAIIDEKIYICKNQAETLFSESFNISDIDTNAYLYVYDAKAFKHKNFKFKNDFFDILIASYVIKTSSKLEIEDILQEHLAVEIERFDQKKLKVLSEDKKLKVVLDICQNLPKLCKLLENDLEKFDTKKTYEKIEKPLIEVLYLMEKRGIKVSIEQFKNLSDEFREKAEKFEKDIYEKAEIKFNIDSPKQLAEVLFEKMGIKGIKKTKRGYSTDASVLEELALRGIPIAQDILEYRKYKKLLSTYTEPIPNFADKNDRVHTSFNATGTVTGRLSSQNPNLQNIPTRDELGTKIRNCFIAEKGKKLISIDYSQIELRVLAFLSKDPNLIDAYKNDYDLHTLTAKKLFGENEEIGKEQRIIGKTINFSVLYGKTAFGLSKELKISMEDAKNYIEKYFEQYSKVMPYIESIIDFAEKNTYVQTYFGTKRYIPGINSKNQIIATQAKRMAVNTVIQGTAANIIKMVMIKLHELGYNMLLQVHDELIFEIDENEAEKEALKIVEIMENEIKFDDVKLKVNYSIANKWGELK